MRPFLPLVVTRQRRRARVHYLKAVRPFQFGSGEHRALFINRRGKPIGKKSVQAIAPYYAAQAGLEEHVTPHTFRRSCTTELIRGNANLYHVKELLGHASLSTLKPYTKLTITDLKKTHAKCHPRELDASDSDSGEATSDDVDCPPSDTPDDQKTEDTRDRHPKS